MSLTDATLEPQLGQTVTLTGRAANAMMGAVVLTADRTPVYVEGLEAWDDTHSGAQVSASGVLRRKSLAPDPTIAADGGVTHGAEGTQYVLEGPSWRLAS